MQPWAVLLAPGSAGHIANIVKGYAIAIGVAFAIWFLWRWWHTGEREVALARSTRARRIWSRHLAFELRHPDVVGLVDGDELAGSDAIRYRTFISMMLLAAEEILVLEPTDAWRMTLAAHFARHRAYLTSAAFCSEILPRLSRPVGELIERLREA